MLKIFLLSWALTLHRGLSFFYAAAALFDTRCFLVRLWAKISKATSFRLVILRVCCVLCVWVCVLVGFRFRASVFFVVLFFYLRRSFLKFPNNFAQFLNSNKLKWLKSRYHRKYLEYLPSTVHLYTCVFYFFLFLLFFLPRYPSLGSVGMCTYKKHTHTHTFQHHRRFFRRFFFFYMKNKLKKNMHWEVNF